MAILRQRLEDALAGRGRVVLVTGEAGAGKTRLAREVLTRARCRKSRALEGACYPAHSTASFTPFVAALRQAFRETPALRIGEVWREALQPLLPELGGTPRAPSGPTCPFPAHEDSWRLEAFYQALRAVARGRGLALLIEDLQWADRASLELLRYVARGIESEPILILATIREDLAPPNEPGGELLQELARLPAAEELTLRPFDLEAIVDLLGFRLPDLERAHLDRLAEFLLGQSSGNAFFVDELANWLAESGPADLTLTETGRLQLELPRSIRGAVGARLRSISEPARSLLTWAAVVGREFDFAVLSRLLGEGPDVLGHLRELIDRRLVAQVLDDERFVFRHPIVREAVYGRLLPPERQALHRSAAEAIEAVHAANLAPHSAELAEHYLAAADSERALEYVLRAGEWAIQVHAYADAVTHFQRALRLWPTGGSSWRRVAVLEALANSFLHTHRFVEADQLLREVLEWHLARGDRIAAARVRAELAHICFYSGVGEEGIRHCEAGLSLLEGLDAPAERADLLTGRARLREFSGDRPGVLADSEAALRLAEQIRDDRRVAAAALDLTYGHAMFGSPAEAEAIARRGLRAAENLGDLHIEAEHLCALGFVYGNVLQDLAQSEALLLRALDIARQTGNRQQEANLMSHLSYCVAIPRGEWERAESLLRDALAIAARIGLRYACSEARIFLGMIAAARGDHAAACADFERGINAVGGQGLFAWVGRHEMGGLLLREGRAREAIDVLEGSLDDQLRSIGPIWTSRLAEAYLLADDRERARDWSARSLEASRRTGRVFDVLETERVAALVAATDGNTSTAVAALEATVARLAQIGRPIDRGRHARDLAELLCRPGPTRDLARAHALLADSQATFSHLGARHDVVLTHAVALRCGLVQPPPQTGRCGPYPRGGPALWARAAPATDRAR